MTLALFDLDNTLLEGDSDYLWGRFLIEHGIVDEASHEAQNQRFFDDYKKGCLDIHAYIAFVAGILSQYDMETLTAWRTQFVAEKIKPIMRPAATALVDKHTQQGHTCIIITATNSFVTAPIAQAFGVKHLLGTDIAMDGTRFSTTIDGTPCFHEGKVTRINAWIEEKQASLTGAWFYSDSHNDLPLMKRVSNPVAVDPDEILLQEAKDREWPVITLKS
ncbi:MAG: HAD family hydrolase [Magnetococcales bacterium]|nr:HAD family hydrolase [Magnetococcales bacterium]